MPLSHLLLTRLVGRTNSTLNGSLARCPTRRGWLAVGPVVMAGIISISSPPAAAEIASMATEGRHALWIDRGNVYGVGSNGYCNLVMSYAGDFKATPVFTGQANAVSVAAAGLQSAVLFADGSARFRGLSAEPSGSRHCHEAPFPMRDITDIALLGSGHTEGGVFFIRGGQVYRWSGYSADLPVALVGGAGAKSIHTGASHLVVLFCDNTVATLGRSDEGQLGTSFVRTAAKPEQSELVRLSITGVETASASGHTSFLRLKDGRVLAFGALSKSIFPAAGGGGGTFQRTPVEITGLPAGTAKLVHWGADAIYAMTREGKMDVFQMSNQLSTSLIQPPVKRLFGF